MWATASGVSDSRGPLKAPRCFCGNYSVLIWLMKTSVQQPSQRPREAERCASTKYFIKRRLIFNCHISAPLAVIKPNRAIQQQHTTLKRWWCMVTLWVSVNSDNSVPSLSDSSPPGSVMSALLSARFITIAPAIHVCRKEGLSSFIYATKQKQTEPLFTSLLTQVDFLTVLKKLVLQFAAVNSSSHLYFMSHSRVLANVFIHGDLRWASRWVVLS